ncbi:wall-associated receptor kinase-like 20 [Pyrus ussuriensis x Pyrus communis]|uniref:Wall-associated receptor kinase-like 20 n=1 Tax=Pyrus ussuriensis x Pyrus communis TaxID=2448454 RepID=A0A5N5F5F0_9ROSA|nr:wall-associated receptor kinase-like 20 [Pyrus ussuriensis x Pyrus communis]
MASPPTLLLFAALLLTSAWCVLSLPRCPDCGTTTVPYPLSTSSTCGDQSYKIRCSAGSLLFDTLNNSYPIESVSPASQRLVLRPSAFLPNTCIATDIIHQGLQLSNSLPFNVTSSNTILYLNCTDTLLRSPLNCTASSLCHTYINGTGSVGSCKESLCCTFRAGGSSTSYMIRVRDSGCSAYTSFVNLDPGLPVDRWPEPGVELQWASPREPECGTQADCEGMSTCGSDPAVAGVRRCFCDSGFTWDPVQGLCVDDSIGSKDRTGLIAGLTCGIGATLIAATIAFLLYKRHRRIKEAQARLTKEREDILNANGGRAAKVFTGNEIKRATNSFSKDRLLGAGGYGEVYQGTLVDGTVVAVKIAKIGNTKGIDQVLNEVRILCQVNHKSLVHLLGCCVELEQPILVYEYIENGTLLEHLQARKPGGWKHLSWMQRLQIALDTAEGLAYLHFSAVPPIYHRDVKSSNILLDERLNAKVADFGLSRLAHTDLSHISTCAQGTLGYLDPEYYRNYQLTDKSDVYSFGVVLLELLTSQKAIDFNREADDVNLAVYAQRMMLEERLMDVIDPLLKEGANALELDTMKALGLLALGCLEERRQNRPSMKEVTEEIEYIASIATAKAVDT